MTSRFLLALLLNLSLYSAFGDTVFLHNGNKVEGKILNENPEEVTVEYYATSTIKDQKTIARADIEKIVKVSPDQMGYEALGSFVTPPTVLDTSFYDGLIDHKIPDFMREYPYSSKVTELRARIKSLDAERQRVKQGDKRINGVWITIAEQQSNPSKTGALLKREQMKAAMQTNNPAEALRDYEQLEKDFPGSSELPDALDDAVKQLDLLQGEISAAKLNYELLEKNRAKAIASSSADQAKILTDAKNKDEATAMTARKTAAADGSKFFPVFPNSKEALDGLQAIVVAERVRLTQLQASMREGFAAWRDCSRLLKEGNLAAARAKLELSQKLWPANSENAKLKAQLDQAQQAAQAQQEQPKP